jgi:hypothetical protein
VEFNDITAKQLSQLHRVVVEAAQASDDDSILATILSGLHASYQSRDWRISDV